MVLLLVLLATTFFAVVKITCQIYIVYPAYESGVHCESSLLSQIVPIFAVALLYLATYLLPVPRLAVVALGIYLDKFNAYTIIAFIWDMYNVENRISVASGYGMVVVSALILAKTMKDGIWTIPKVPLASLFTVQIVAVLMLKYAVADHLKFSIVAVNVAASLVFFVSATESDLKTSRLIPVVLAAVSLVLEYVILQNGFSPLSVVNIVLPLLISVNGTDDSEYQIDGDSKTKILEQVVPSSRSVIKELLSHSDTRAIFNFLLLNATFMFIQLLYSFRSKSLGLLSDSLHMALDCTSLALGLLAGVLSKQPADGNGRFPFGLKNFETLAGFTNGTLLIGISGSIVFEAIGRLFNPVKLQKTNELIIVSFLGLLVNLVGIFAFNHGHGHGHSHSHSHGHSHTHETDSNHTEDLQHSHDHGHTHSHHTTHSQNHSHDGQNHSHDDENHSHGMNENMKGIFLHILADTLGSVGVVISTVLTKAFAWEGFDPIASIIIACLIFFSSLPLIKTTASALLLQVSPKKEIIVREVLNEILAIKGVKSITTPRFWPINNELQGYIHIQIFRGENGGYIKKQCEKAFESRAIVVTIQMEYDYDDCWCRKKKQ